MAELSLSDLGLSMEQFAKPKKGGDLPTCESCPALRPGQGQDKHVCKRRSPQVAVLPMAGPLDGKGNQTTFWKSVPVYPPAAPTDEACFEHPQLVNLFEGERR